MDNPTFADLDRAKGYPELPEATEEEFPLPAWYRQVCRTPLDKLSLFDVCRACQQQIHLDHVVPLALKILSLDPLAGERSDGELISALINLPQKFWAAHAKELSEVRDLCALIRADDNFDDDPSLITEIESFLDKAPNNNPDATR